MTTQTFYQKPDAANLLRPNDTIATARGVVIVEAAGNGAEDLEGWTDRSRLDFSNYGSRLDVQGWGRMVATNDYGDLQGCDATSRKYTNLFGGTSSASPIVAGAALLIQSIIKTERKGCAIQPKDLRKILTETGSPQTDGPHGPTKQRIGPRPDLVRAIERARATPKGCADPDL